MLTAWDRQRGEWEQILREVFPLDLPPTRPVYIVDAVDAGPWIAAEVAHGWAATGPALDIRLRPRLEMLGEWRGRGFAVAIPDLAAFSCRFSAAEQLGIIGHEFAHQLDAGDHWADSEGTGELLNAIRPEVVATVMVEMATRPRPPWIGHEARFTRAGLHVHHRLQAAGHRVSLESMHIAGPTFGLSATEAYRAALGDEPHDRADEPIGSIIGDPAPPTFSALWEADTATQSA